MDMTVTISHINNPLKELWQRVELNENEDGQIG